MRRLITLLVYAAMMFPASHAQQASETSEPERVTYFLIDASGSMAKDRNGDEAETKVLEKLTEIRAVNPAAPVSRTYFRAANQDLCWHTVEISTPVPASESEREFQIYGNDFTPLGAALEAAILDAGAGPADIFILSDEVQSPNCGVDICTVARTYLPLSDIKVESIPIGDEGKRDNRLACIETANAQADPASTVVDAREMMEFVESRTVGEEASIIEMVARNLQTFVETWFWFFGVGFIAWAAFAFGWRQSNSARIVEENTKQARSFQEQIRDGDEEALKELNKLTSSAEQRGQNDSDKTTKRLRVERRAKLTKRLNNVLGVIGLLMLIGLAMLPPIVFGVSLGATKEAAWRIFNSDFATAFAVMWIAMIFFAGSQFQRRQEADHNFSIVTREAERTAERERTEAQREAFASYSSKSEEFSKLKFATLWSIQNLTENDPLTKQEEDDTRLVEDYVKTQVLNKPLQKSDSRRELERESSRLDQLRIRIRRYKYWPEPDFGKLVDCLLFDGAVSAHEGDWRNLLEALRRGDHETVRECIKTLADKIRTLPAA